MSGQGTQRVRRIASPSTKQGPMKATLTFGLVHGSPTRNANGKKLSPSSSPIQWISDGKHKSRKSSENRSSPDRISPSSPGSKVEHPKAIRASPVSLIKRTGSLETLGPYLTGQWPKEPRDVSFHTPVSAPIFCLDKATQTPDNWTDHGSLEKRKRHSHKRSASVGNGDSRKELKSRWKKSEGLRISTPPSRTSPIPVMTHLTVQNSSSSSLIQSRAVAIPLINIPRPVTRMRGSVEGPSQEVERALRRISSLDDDYRTQDPVPDGHRAPVNEILSGFGTRSIDTQTPSGHKESCIDEEEGRSSGGSSQSSPSMVEVSLSFSQDTQALPDEERAETEGSEGDEPAIKMRALAIDDYEDELDDSKGFESEGGEEQKLVPSPKPNKSFSFVREPPDGCEKVKIIEEFRYRSTPSVKESLLYCPIPKPSAYRIPSVDSAFCPLYKPYVMCQAASVSNADMLTTAAMRATTDTCQ